MKMIISNSSSVPIYQQIKNCIIDQIMNGDLDELIDPLIAADQAEKLAKSGEEQDRP